ncbi:Vacuolar morphogenesis protein-like protein [Emericellopsis cladophorae]|uniref:Vacuolar morphogenesis protein-like protein n=1 Tax=Emericellopsis cladophorae TaxID=2686198 RepID=A0A9Q0BGS5_9HYPO|nr:Vacuolar morphogenesis protein-like protein [Emericellopsis cladophorae]KAI6783664.1 Vacuolar morphogenesis protein-like protein [Emericellopsis cladophorae]
MLSAFTARPIIELRLRDKSKIESILAHGRLPPPFLNELSADREGDRILVGLNTGALRVYRLNDLHPSDDSKPSPNEQVVASPPQNGERPTSRSNPSRPTDLLREIEKFSTRGVEQLAIIKEANTIVSLSNYHVSLHHLHNYELVETLSRTKNATCFAVTSNIVKDAETGIPEIISRLVVAVKRRILLWSWHESELSEQVAEISLSETIRSVTWANATKLLCGMNGGYVMVDVISHDVEEIMSPGTMQAGNQGSRFGAVGSAGMGYMGLGGYMPKPLAARLAEGEMLLAKDINTLFVDDKGKPLDRKQIPWQSAPESIGYSYPYILALLQPSKGSLEVRNPETLTLLQSISLPGASQLHFAPPTSSLAHAGKGFHISSDRCIWKMDTTDYDSQIQELIRSTQYDEAISVLGMLEDALLKNKTETLREVKMLKAESLFRQKKFRQSMDLFNEDDVHAPPERVLRLFPPRISGELSAYPDHEEASPQQDDTPSKKTNGTRSDSPVGSADPSSPPNIGSFAKLFGGGHKKASDAASITSKKETKEEPEADDSSASAKDTESQDPLVLEGKDLTNAVLELNSYLAGTRARLQRVIDPITGQLKPRSDSNGSLEDAAERFLRTSPTDTEKELEETLRKTFRVVDTTLFRAYMFSRPTLAGSLFRIPNFCDPDVVNERLLEQNRYMELIDFFYGKKLHKEALELLKKFGSATKPDPAAPTLHGPDRAIQYLQGLSPENIDLILEHAKWTLKANAGYAMEIFVGDTENAETLPRERVLTFLKEQDPQLEAQYLAHIIDELGDDTTEFHNRLVQLYVRNLTTMVKGEEWDRTMHNFLNFLRESKQYSLSKAFSLIPRDDAIFYESQAVVLSNMGQHKQALEIFVFKLKDYAKAEDYCNRVLLSQDTPTSVEDPDDSAPSIYHTLLSLYLQPPSSHKPDLPPALDLLSKHGSRLPATSTLSLIPDDIPVGDLEAYFRGRIRAVNSLVNQTRVVAGLRKSEGISVAARLHLGDDQEGGQGGRNRHVTITDERHCVVCHKKLGGGMRMGGTVVAVLPDNTVVHYSCLSRVPGQRPESSRAPSWGRGF